jgi:hypothetical protein
VHCHDEASFKCRHSSNYYCSTHFKTFRLNTNHGSIDKNNQLDAASWQNLKSEIVSRLASIKKCKIEILSKAKNLIKIVEEHCNAAVQRLDDTAKDYLDLIQDNLFDDFSYADAQAIINSRIRINVQMENVEIKGIKECFRQEFIVDEEEFEKIEEKKKEEEKRKEMEESLGNKCKE